MDQVTLSYDKSAAVVVLPAVGKGRLRDEKLVRWLSRSTIERTDPGRGRLTSILAELGKAPPQEGTAALRMWGQTGDRPAVWIAAADPVYLEPQLDRLRLHALGPDALSGSEIGALFDYLQRRLGDDAGYGFARLGTRGYLRTNSPIETSAAPSEAIDGLEPDAFMPEGTGAAGYRRLLSEIEMALHDHEINVLRSEAGDTPVNSLWIWGGGYAPELATVPHPPLFADDPMLKGYWLSNTGVVDAWPGTIAACLDGSVAGFVAVIPDAADEDALETCLYELKDALHVGRLSQLRLLFRDGIRAVVVQADAYRVWRRRSSLLTGNGP